MDSRLRMIKIDSEWFRDRVPSIIVPLRPPVPNQSATSSLAPIRPIAPREKKASSSGGSNKVTLASVISKSMDLPRKCTHQRRYEPLALSLQSPFPNEHELGLKMLLALSTVGDLANEVKLNAISNTPALLNMLLAHVGFYCDALLRELHEDAYSEASEGPRKKEEVDFQAFWSQVCGAVPGEEQDSQDLLQLLAESYPSSDLEQVEKMETGEWDKLAATLMSKGDMTERLQFRVEMVTTILRNFSCDPPNAKAMSGNVTFLRFLLIAVQSEFRTFPQLAWDMIGNVAPYLALEKDVASPEDVDQLSKMLADYAKDIILHSNDRFKIIRAVETIRGMVSRGQNELDVFVEDPLLLNRLFNLILLPDNLLMLHSLECIHSLSRLGKEVCDKIVEVKGSLATLVAYLTTPNPSLKVSESIHVSAALILREMVRYPGPSRSMMIQYEPHILEHTVNHVDCARVLADVLYFLSWPK